MGLEFFISFLVTVAVHGRLFFSFEPKQVYPKRSSEYWYGGINHVKTGDEVYVLAGCHVSVILRPNGIQHYVVGNTYVNGYMRVEAMSGVLDPSEILSDIYIR